MSSELRVDKIIPTAGVPTGGGGGIIQIVQGSLTGNVSTSGNIDSGLQVIITPKFATSKIYVTFDGFLWCDMTGSNNDVQGGAYLTRTVGGSVTNITPDANVMRFVGSSQSYWDVGNLCTITKLDSPNTTSAVTYKLKLHATSGTTTIQLNNTFYNSTSTEAHITAMEVSA